MILGMILGFGTAVIIGVILHLKDENRKLRETIIGYETAVNQMIERQLEANRHNPKVPFKESDFVRQPDLH